MVSMDHSDVYTDFQGLARLKGAAKQNDPQALEKVAEQFEAVFLQTMLKTMRQASLGDGIFDSNQSRVYQDMFDQQIALNMAQKREAGIADMMVQQLSRQQGMVAAPTTGEANAGSGFDNSRLQRRIQPVDKPLNAFAPVDRGLEKIKGFDSPQDFVEKLWPMAEKAAAELGVSPKVLLAQSALETGWGKYVNKYSNGVSSHNLFNIKADKRWDGERTMVSTLEYEGGVPVRQNAMFRAYPTFEKSFSDYVDFVKSSPRYQEALSKGGDDEAYIRELHKAGYATDPQYSSKISRLMNGQVLNGAMAEIKDSSGGPLT